MKLPTNDSIQKMANCTITFQDARKVLHDDKIFAAERKLVAKGGTQIGVPVISGDEDLVSRVAIQ